MKLEVISEFNAERCPDCVVQRKCKAGAIVTQVDVDLIEHAKTIIDHHAEDIGWEVASGEFGNLDDLHNELAKASGRAAQVREKLDEALTAAAPLSTLDTSRQIEQDDHSVALEQAMDLLGAAPHPTEFLTGSDMPEMLETASQDVVRFCQQGICTAVEIRTVPS